MDQGLDWKGLSPIYQEIQDTSPRNSVPTSAIAITRDKMATTAEHSTPSSSIDRSALNPTSNNNGGDKIEIIPSEDPYSLRTSKYEDFTKQTIIQRHKTRKVKKYYNRQNALIDAYLGSADEEAAEIEDEKDNGGKVKFAVYGSTTVNLFLFIIQLYAAVSTGSLSLFGTAADAFVSLECQN